MKDIWRSKIARFYILASLPFLIGIFFLAVFYSRYELVSDHLEKDLGYKGAEANAIKHAYAASELYDGLSHILETNEAEQTVLFLGLVNEYVERVTKFRKQDSAKEIMKDLHNNVAGIVVAQRSKSNTEDVYERLDILKKLADEEVLVTARDRNPFFSDDETRITNPVAYSRRWLDKNKKDIKQRVTDSLQNHHN